MRAVAMAVDSRSGEAATGRLGAVAARVEPVGPETSCAEVYDRFRGDPDLIAIPVVDGEAPIGLVNRHDLTMALAQDYGRALYAKKPITVKMDGHPLIVDSSVQIEALEWLIANEKP